MGHWALVRRFIHYVCFASNKFVIHKLWSHLSLVFLSLDIQTWFSWHSHIFLIHSSQSQCALSIAPFSREILEHQESLINSTHHVKMFHFDPRRPSYLQCSIFHHNQVCFFPYIGNLAISIHTFLSCWIILQCSTFDGIRVSFSSHSHLCHIPLHIFLRKPQYTLWVATLNETLEYCKSLTKSTRITWRYLTLL